MTGSFNPTGLRKKSFFFFPRKVSLSWPPYKRSSLETLLYPISLPQSPLLFLLLFSQSCLTLCNPMDCSTPGFSSLHYLLEFTQGHVHWVSDAIQPSHPLSSPSPPAFNLPQHLGSFSKNQLFASSGQSIGAPPSASVLPMKIQG